MQNKNNFTTTIQEIRNMLNECGLMCNTAIRLYENKEYEDANEVCMDLVPIGEGIAMLVRKLPLFMGRSDTKECVEKEVKDFYEIEARITKEGWIQVVIPFLLPKREKGTTEYLRSIIYPSLQEFFQDKAPINFNKAVLAYRHIYDKNRKERRKRDHENFEINMVSDTLALFALPDDGPDTCNHFYCSKEGNRECTEVYVLPQKDFIEFYKSKVCKVD